MNNADILRIAMEQSAIDANCTANDFTRSENVVVISKPNDKARVYLELPFFCNIISYGNNVVASVDEAIAEYIAKYISNKHHHYSFEIPNILFLSDETKQYGFLPCFQAEYWLPDVGTLKELQCRYETRILMPDDFTELYLPEWSNALSLKRSHLDMLGIGAYDDGRLIGLSGCSADCATMWQIGVDVLPEYRRQGVAAALTSRLAIEVLERNKVPFYCCAWSNLASVRNAFRGGFRPAWVESQSVRIEDALKWNSNSLITEEIE